MPFSGNPKATEAGELNSHVQRCSVAQKGAASFFAITPEVALVSLSRTRKEKSSNGTLLQVCKFSQETLSVLQPLPSALSAGISPVCSTALAHLAAGGILCSGSLPLS